MKRSLNWKETYSFIALLLLIIRCGPDPIATISYPPTGAYGDNLLLPSKTTYTNKDNSLQVVLPPGKSVKIVLTALTSVGGLLQSGIWTYSSATVSNWNIANFNAAAVSQTFSSLKDGQPCDVKLSMDRGTYQIEYFENGATGASSTKTVTVNY